MKTKLLFTLSIFWVISGFAQFGQQQIISTDTEKPSLSIPFDIDNDGDIDILTASAETYQLSWYKNLDGNGNFGNENIIDGTSAFYLSIDFVDIDTDGDKDILYLRNNPRQVVWVENLDGAGNFGNVQVLLEEDFISSIISIDMDNDGDQDLIAAITDTFTGWITWYENLDGQGTFGEENLLIENWEEFFKIMMIDIDGDGLKDILAVGESYAPATIFWYKNMGNTTFGAAQVIYQFQTLLSDWTSIYDLQISDINTDGKKDIIITTYQDDNGILVYWLENLDGLGNYGSLQYIDNTNDAYLFYDLDNDNDNDMLLYNIYTNKIAWKKNEDGFGNFGAPIIISPNGDFERDADAADIDGDGWLDIVSASAANNKLAWYKNNRLGISEYEFAHSRIYPNPTAGILYIESKQPISQISVFTILGQRIETKQNTNQVDLSKAEAGVYILNIEDANGNSHTHKIVKE